MPNVLLTNSQMLQLDVSPHSEFPLVALVTLQKIKLRPCDWASTALCGDSRFWVAVTGVTAP